MIPACFFVWFLSPSFSYICHCPDVVVCNEIQSVNDGSAVGILISSPISFLLHKQHVANPSSQ